MSEIYSLFIISLVAALAPLLGRLPQLAQTPVVVIELVLGILIGPSVANWVASDSTIGFLGIVGLSFLFFQAGLDFDKEKIGAQALRLGAIAWLASFGLACIFVGLLYFVGLLRAPLLVALVLPTTAFGILIPILRQTGDLDSDFGRYLLGLAAAGELGPVMLASVALAHANHHLHQTLLSIGFLAIAVGAIFLARTLPADGLSRAIGRWMGDGSILPVRIAILILLGLVSLASELGMETVLGAYAAGVIVALLARGDATEALVGRLTSISSGFFIPMFFITSGVELDLIGLVTSPASLLRLALFTLALLFIRIVPIRLYRGGLPDRDLLPLALLSSTTLGLVVAVTYLGVRTGQMSTENASALVGAAVISVAVFPTLAISLRAQSDEARAAGFPALIARRAGDFAATQLIRLKGLMSQKG
ncbi:cation:proton antiporter [Methylocapsa acidiphila]|uniref:cation:proton antiporter n=1 Tax=Methylocapsa acidiphila TaxID=133552 RepID=UPI00041E8182|nr:cation:proton antiporter [Methylocapsa acidiphila]